MSDNIEYNSKKYNLEEDHKNLPSGATVTCTYNEPAARHWHCGCLVDLKWVVYAGLVTLEDGFAPTNIIYVMDTKTEEWEEIETFGSPPTARYSIAATSVGSDIYYFGGGYSSSSDITGNYSRDLHKLDMLSKVWHKIEAKNQNECPLPRRGACMIAFGKHLVIYGGICSLVQSREQSLTNEVVLYNIERNIWVLPFVNGELPPCSMDSTLTRIDDHRAVLFGGYVDESWVLPDFYILNFLSWITMTWTRISQRSVDMPWPSARSAHTALSLFDPNCNPDKPEVMVIWGTGPLCLCEDMWVFNVHQRTCTKVVVQSDQQPQKSRQSRFLHTSAIIYLSSVRKIFHFGGVDVSKEMQTGRRDPFNIPPLAATVIDFVSRGSTSSWMVSKELNHPTQETIPVTPTTGHILTQSELQVLSDLLDAYSNEKIKEIRESIQKKQGGEISREEVKDLLREGGMMAIANELEQILQKGVENAEHYQAYNAALEGAITLPLRYLKFLFFGSPRSGKSTMRQRLLQEIINLAILGQPSLSTGVAEVCEVIIKKMTSETAAIASETASIAGKTAAIAGETAAIAGETAAIAGSQWHSLKKSIATKDNVVGIDIEYLTQIFYHLISKTVASIPSPTSEAIPQAADSETSNGSDDLTPHDDNDVSVPDEPFPTQEKVKHEEASVEVSVGVSTNHSSDSEIAEVDKAFDELSNILQSGSPEELYLLLESLTLINMSDVGGQPEFLDVLPALTVGAALYLLFFRLDQEVHKRYPVKYLAPGSAIERTLTSTYCIEEVLHQALASIACFSGHSSEESAYSAPSHAILVGTYKDQVTASDIAEKEKEIQEKFTSAEVYKRLLLTTKEGKPFFTVDNINGTDESEMSEIRSNIENIVKTFFEEVPIPASWLMFRIMLHLLNKPVVSLSQCEEIARRLSMPTPVQEALWFFHHHVGSLLYYPDIPSMRGTVICTPQVIFDSISTVIIGNFRYSNYLVAREAVEQFQQTGLFSLSDISDKTKEHRSSHLTPNQLVDVLKHQGILAEVKHDEEESSSQPAESKFIIPAVLEHASQEELKPSPSLQASPLMIRFEGGFVPFGVFSASVARLIAHADSMSPKWKLCSKEVRKNKVRFLVSGAYNVTLISRPRYLEIQLERYSLRARCKHSLADICSAVRQTIVETLETTISKMQYRPQACVASVLLSTQRPFHLAFSCCVSESEPHSGHLMKVDEDEDGHYGVCLRDGAEVDLDKEHLYWLDKNELEVASQSEATATFKSNIASNNSGKLSIEDLQRVRTTTWDARAKWYDIGLALCFSADTLDAVRETQRGDCTKCYTEMLADWLRGVDPQPTWGALSEALKLYGYGHLAEQLPI